MKYFTIVTKLFRNHQQMKFFGLMCLSTLFCFSLILMRIWRLDLNINGFPSYESYLNARGTKTFLFLVWNLFLAWVPYVIALMLPWFSKRFDRVWLTLVLIGIWLCFFPNAPYILTDLFHLKNRAPIPHWYDLMLILSFAWTGLMLGYLSLLEIQHFISKKHSSFIAWIFSLGFIGLCGFGVYLGRFLRWNSWDVITKPQIIFNDLFNIITHPFHFPGALGMTLILSTFILLGYLVLWVAMDQKELSQSK